MTMSVICPTITTNDPHKYREQMEIIASYTEGVHLDFTDGVFAPSELLPIEDAWRSDDLVTHAHIMYQNPLLVVDDIMLLSNNKSSIVNCEKVTTSVVFVC